MVSKRRILMTLSALVFLTAISAAPKLFKAPKSAAPGEPVVVTYKSAISSPEGDRYWITITEASAADSEWGAWAYVEDGATSTTLTAPAAPGSYEIRLHDHYPTNPFNVAQRSALTVQ